MGWSGVGGGADRSKNARFAPTALVSVDISRLSCSRTVKVKTYGELDSGTWGDTICVVRGTPWDLGVCVVRLTPYPSLRITFWIALIDSLKDRASCRKLMPCDRPAMMNWSRLALAARRTTALCRPIALAHARRSASV